MVDKHCLEQWLLYRVSRQWQGQHDSQPKYQVHWSVSRRAELDSNWFCSFGPEQTGNRKNRILLLKAEKLYKSDDQYPWWRKDRRLSVMALTWTTWGSLRSAMADCYICLMISLHNSTIKIMTEHLFSACAVTHKLCCRDTLEILVVNDQNGKFHLTAENYLCEERGMFWPLGWHYLSVWVLSLTLSRPNTGNKSSSRFSS